MFLPQKGWIIGFSLTTGYFLANILLHKRMCDLADFLVEKLTRARLDDYLFQVEYLLLLILVLFLGWFIFKSRGKRVYLLFFGGAVGIAAYVANRFLLVVHLEKIHYPQYAILAVLLLLWIKNAYRVLKIATCLGIVDELYQWYFLSSNRRTNYIDFNDMILNLLGVLMGILIVFSLKYLREEHKNDYTKLGAVYQLLMNKLTHRKIYEIVVLILLGLAIPGLVFSSILVSVFQDVYQAFLFSYQVGKGNFLITPSNGLSYHVLTPIEGGCLLILMIIASKVLLARLIK
jgi:hypothetical protein